VPPPSAPQPVQRAPLPAQPALRVPAPPQPDRALAASAPAKATAVSPTGTPVKDPASEQSSGLTSGQRNIGSLAAAVLTVGLLGTIWFGIALPQAIARVWLMFPVVATLILLPLNVAAGRKEGKPAVGAIMANLATLLIACWLGWKMWT